MRKWESKSTMREISKKLKEVLETLKGRMEARKESDEAVELFAGEGGSAYTVIYILSV